MRALRLTDSITESCATALSDGDSRTMMSVGYLTILPDSDG